MSEILKQKAISIANAFTKWGLWQGSQPTPRTEIHHLIREVTTDANGYARLLTSLYGITIDNIIQINLLDASLCYCNWWIPTGGSNDTVYAIVYQRHPSNLIAKANTSIKFDIMYAVDVE